jgi:hypothetical protein
MIFTDEERTFRLPRKFGDRLIVFVFGCVLTGFFALMHFRLESSSLSGWLGKVLHGLAIETMFTCADLGAFCASMARGTLESDHEESLDHNRGGLDLSGVHV